MKGQVRVVKIDKGFGFIRAEDGSEYFFHRSGFNGHWNDLCDDFTNSVKIPVEFEKDENDAKGPRARNVRRLDHPNQS